MHMESVFSIQNVLYRLEVFDFKILYMYLHLKNLNKERNKQLGNINPTQSK